MNNDTLDSAMMSYGVGPDDAIPMPSNGKYAGYKVELSGVEFKENYVAADGYTYTGQLAKTNNEDIPYIPHGAVARINYVSCEWEYIDANIGENVGKRIYVSSSGVRLSETDLKSEKSVGTNIRYEIDLKDGKIDKKEKFRQYKTTYF